ncbi:MAG: 2-phospho-L-lactate transferase [Pseudomonadota bacterium]
MRTRTKVTLIAGGVGGAKMAEGLASLEGVDLSIICNVADDEAFHGLWVSPDVDTMIYTLSGRINRQQGWGVDDDAGRALSVLSDLGAETWMFLGDRDFGLHIYRTERLRRGDRPQDITQDIASGFGVRATLYLPTDDRVQTRVRTSNGWLTFQEYFVRERCEPEVLALRYEGIEAARPNIEAISALLEADLIVIAPSNPLVSVAPILDIVGISENLKRSKAPVFAVSPLIAGKVVKGPADRMMRAMGLRADVVGVAERYAGLAEVLFIDHADQELSQEVAACGMTPVCRDIVMPDGVAKTRLAREILDHFRTIQEGRAA